MAVYTVQRGDTLSGIAKKLGIADWRTLYNLNKSIIGSNPNVIRVGQKLNYGTSTPNNTTSSFVDQASKQLGLTYQNPKPFSEVVPWEQFFPEQQVQAFTESRVNPEAARVAEQQVGQFDWRTALSNAFRTGFAQQGRTSLQNQLERDRKAQIAELAGQQRDIFNNLYGQESVKYYDNPANYSPTAEDYIKRFLPNLSQ